MRGPESAPSSPGVARTVPVATRARRADFQAALEQAALEQAALEAIDRGPPASGAVRSESGPDVEAAFGDHAMACRLAQAALAGS